MNEKIYHQVREKAFSIALQILKNPDYSEDIAQNVALKYLQHEKEISEPLAWSYIVSKNECMKLIRKEKKLNDLFQEKKLNTNIENKQDLAIDKIELKEAKKILSKTDLRVYKLYIKHNRKINKIARSLRKNKSATYNAIFKMKKNLIAYRLLQNGWHGTKKIINYNMHRKITRFIKKYLQCCKTQNLNSMKKYFRNLVFNEIPIIKYNEVKDFTFNKKKNGNFDLCLPFINKANKVNMVYFVLNKDIERNLLVNSAKLVSTKIYIHNNPKIVRKNQKPLSKGLLQESKKQIVDLVLSLGGKEQD